MNIKELLELGDKRTLGEWRRDVSKSISSTHKSVRRQVLGQTWYEEKEKYNDFFSPQDLDYILAAPQMEAKLREIVDILPEIKQIMIWAMDTPAEKDTIAMMEKIEKWENN